MALAGNQPVTIINNVGGVTEEMTGATSEEAGASGLVPAPQAGDDTKFLRGDGSWQEAGAGEVSPGPLEFEMGNAPGMGAIGGVTETTPFAGFVTVQTGDPVDNTFPNNVATLNYGTPREDNEDIPVQVTPINQATAELTWWVLERDEQFTIRATNLQPNTFYGWAYSLY